MRIDPAQAPSVDSIFLEQMQDLGMISRCGQGKRLKQIQDLIPVSDISASQFTNDEGVTDHGSLFQQFRQTGWFPPQMVNPDRGINQDHQVWVFRRGILSN